MPLCVQTTALQGVLAKFGIMEVARTGKIALKRSEQLLQMGGWGDGAAQRAKQAQQRQQAAAAAAASTSSSSNSAASASTNGAAAAAGAEGGPAVLVPASSGGGEEGRERAQRQQQSHTAQVPPEAVREGDVYVIGENGQPGAGRLRCSV